MPSDEQFDAIVIGSGIGGLSAARMLAEFGSRKVLVLEQHYTLGGMTHEFTRDGRYHFGTGLHYLTRRPSPALNHLTDGRVSFKRLPDDYDILHFPGFDFAVPSSAEAFKRGLKLRFAAEAAAVDAFFSAVGKAARGVLARHIVSALPAPVRALGIPIIAWLHQDTFRTVKTVVARHFEDPALRAIVSARWGLYGPPPAISAFGGHAAVSLEGFINGASHPVGGPRELSRTIVEGLQRFGVELRPRQRVREVLSDNGSAVGVQVEDQLTGVAYQVSTPLVVSAVGARNTAKLLRGSDAAAWERKLAQLPKEISALLLFVGLRQSPAVLGLNGENHWFMPSLDDDTALSHPLGEGVLFVSFASLNNPAATHHTVEVMHFVAPERFSAWFGSEQGARSRAYEELKTAITERLLERLERQWPGFRQLVDIAELATPLSFATYQNSVQGAIYGLANSPERLRSPLAGSRTSIKGLYLAGQDAASPGVEAALWSGMMVASAVLGVGQARRMWRAVGALPAFERRASWSGYLRIAAADALTPTIRRLRLAPFSGGELPFRFAAGQYVKLELPVQDGTIERSYSICSSSAEARFFDLAVKQEEGGLGSAFLHEVTVGGALRLSAAFGDFTADFTSELQGPVVLIAGGVGIAPMLGLLEGAAAARYRGPLTLLASFRTEADIVFRRELETLGHDLPNLTTLLFLTRPSLGWRGLVGRIDRNAIRPHALPDRHVYLCGPAGMMQALIGDLLELGMPRNAIHTEAFVSSVATASRAENARQVARAAVEAGIERFVVTVRGGASFECRPGQNLLAAANAASIPFDQSCTEGACGKCRTCVLAGQFLTGGSALLSAAEIADGWVLACQTLPREDLEIGFGAPPGAGFSTSLQR
jgi:all-trans-retinol 13,14-reductase